MLVQHHTYNPGNYSEQVGISTGREEVVFLLLVRHEGIGANAEESVGRTESDSRAAMINMRGPTAKQTALV
jgi:hypothetical protein